ncbi:MAG: hypothetical protein A2445_01880 [Candidatus Jacksonbacteria bacterium RIFOXYC2_FULL_44_29]|nr:MAG: hypothetical protein A2240_03355 [Candidatus Jacksonbacteria bacterium RIFOXYA2_FULL_43_12]OGY75845.1 MAG: hypothetical protein A2295_00075 [Candidatus Jacksonbacteria bacterium RIFOXYB2_FULL_44_15]OGY77897.1 MAG: hypothetical protein A2445_01880 [Candidatus Jacksonbacteria bacterium RIFOXYC2_FULL_44_29]OGY80129.1 MAG: hypothetical protein A2550_05340 [Candidatus Jacksonbacteria bacterium RIFOXYD2_FULL_43_21]
MVNLREKFESSPVANEMRVLLVDPAKIVANPYQPRSTFEQDKLQELADSIRQHGILSPLLVTKHDDGRLELIAGERRLRASLDLRLKEVPVIVRQAGDLQKLEWSLIENLQREDLNPMELARSYQKILSDFGLTQEQLASAVGKSRPQVANVLRLQDLPVEIQNSIISGEITEGHAKAILSLEEQQARLNLWKKITLNNLTVRLAEREAQQVKVISHSRRLRQRDPNVSAYEARLEERLGTRAQIKGGLAKGQIVVEYFSQEELERIVNSF